MELCRAMVRKHAAGDPDRFERVLQNHIYSLEGGDRINTGELFSSSLAFKGNQPAHASSKTSRLPLDSEKPERR